MQKETGIRKHNCHGENQYALSLLLLLLVVIIVRKIITITITLLITHYERANDVYCAFSFRMSDATSHDRTITLSTNL